jgi:HlyD family secretion protein
MSKTSKRVVILTVLAIAALAGYYVFGKLNPPVMVKAMTLKKGDLLVTVTATTTSTINSEHTIIISAQRMGRVAELPIEEGDFVKKGQVLVGLDKQDVTAELMQAEANLSLARDRLAEAQAGVGVQKGSSEAVLAEARSVYKEAEQNLERSKRLFEKGMISHQEKDSAQRSFDVAKARYESALSGMDINEVKRQEVAGARSGVKQAEAALEKAKVQLNYCTIKAPIDGVVSKRVVDIGEMVNIGSPVADIVDPADIYVLSTIDEVDVSKLEVGMRVNIHVDALPDKLFDGEITRISPIVSGQKQETRTFEVRTRFKQKVAFLKPGMSADIEALAKEMKDVLHVPAQAVVEREGKKMVYVIEHGKARLVPVQIGYLSWSDAVLTGGVKEGDRVITTPDAAGLKEGAAVSEITGT